MKVQATLGNQWMSKIRLLVTKTFFFQELVSLRYFFLRGKLYISRIILSKSAETNNWFSKKRIVESFTLRNFSIDDVFYWEFSAENFLLQMYYSFQVPIQQNAFIMITQKCAYTTYLLCKLGGKCVIKVSLNPIKDNAYPIAFPINQ